MRTLSLEGKLCHQLTFEPARRQLTWPTLVTVLQCQVFCGRFDGAFSVLQHRCGATRCFYASTVTRVGPRTVRPNPASHGSNCATKVVASSREADERRPQSSLDSACLEKAKTTICATAMSDNQEIRCSCDSTFPVHAITSGGEDDGFVQSPSLRIQNLS